MESYTQILSQSCSCNQNHCVSPSLCQLFRPLWQSAVGIWMEVQWCLHHALAYNMRLWLKDLAPCTSPSQHWCLHSWSSGTSASRGMWKNWKGPAKGCNHGPVSGVQIWWDRGGRSWVCFSQWEEAQRVMEQQPWRAGLLEEQVQKWQTQPLLGHVRGLNKAHMADGDVQFSLFL